MFAAKHCVRSVLVVQKLFQTPKRWKSCGLVGKSTLFNSLTASTAAAAENFPFCTIEANVGLVAVPDRRLNQLAKIAGSKKIIPSQIEFHDIAGLVEGASEGKGLGNKFLADIRSVSVVVNVLRCFDDEDVLHVESSVDPIRDFATIQTELILADMQSVEKRLEKLKASRKRTPEENTLLAQLAAVLPALEDGRRADSADVELDAIARGQLLTAKPQIVVCNVDDVTELDNNTSFQRVKAELSATHAVIPISAKLEAELGELAELEQREEFMEACGIEHSGIELVGEACKEALGLITFFTVGPQEAHAWDVRKGASAVEAAGKIHTDIAKGFVKAETVGYDTFVECGSMEEAAKQGLMRMEGKEYTVEDGDIFHFRFTKT